MTVTDSQTQTVTGAVLAAGAGTRIGQPKADLIVDGARLLDRATAALRDGGCDPVLAVVRPGTVVSGASAIVNRDPGRGLRSSLALAVAAADPAGELLVVLVDLPGLGASAVRAVREAMGAIRQAVYHGQVGHPLVMTVADWRQALAMAGPDEGARRYLREQNGRVTLVPVDGDPADLDTPADLARWTTRPG